MIKYINTKDTSKETLYTEIKKLRSNLQDEFINKIIIDPMYENYDECVYKFTTDEYIAYKPKDSNFWIENAKNDIIYVETHTTPKDIIIKAVAKKSGIPVATTKVNKWYEDNSAFVFDISADDILFTKSRYRGNWEGNTNVLLNYKK